MLHEDDVVEAVSVWLTGRGWTIVSKALAVQRGDDIVAQRGDVTLRVEAKGGGSSKPGTPRFGQEFTLGQSQVNVGMAILRALAFVERAQTLGVVAFPDTPNYRRVLAPVLPALGRTGMAVLCVDENGQVDVLLSADL